MSILHWRWSTAGVLLCGLGGAFWGASARGQASADDPPPLEVPLTAPAAVESVPRVDAPAAEPARRLHEAILTAPTPDRRVTIPKSPPPPVTEQPGMDAPNAQARWVPGYWSWDPAQDDFVWVAGIWRVPPPNSIWVGGRWMRDADGWYRVPGFWSRRRPGAVGQGLTSRPAWRTSGPPADPPAEPLGPAPGPDYFLVAGHYGPVGERLVWTPSFWARGEPGWDWIPARWVRLADGWVYREGSWVREPSAAETSRHVVARPESDSGIPPAIVESEPAVADSRTDQTAPPGAESGRDVMAEAEASGRAVDPPAAGAGRNAPTVVSPGIAPYPVPYVVGRPPVGYGYGYGYGMPYRVIRPPGAYPYGPGGVIVPAAVPPFVQRLLDRVLP